MYHDVQSWIVQADWLFSGVSQSLRGKQGPERLREILACVKTGTVLMEDAYLAMKTVAHPWLIRRWFETKGADGEPLVTLPDHVIHDIRLKYTKAELDRLRGFVGELKSERKGHVATVIHEFRLACFSMSLPGNDTVPVNDGDDYQFRNSWDRQTYHAGPVIRWLAKTLVPILVGEPTNGLPNKAVIFTPLPGQAWFVHWVLKTFHRQLRPFIFHADLSRPKRHELIEEFSGVDSPAARVLTPTLGGTGLNPVAANCIVNMQRFSVLNEQRQAISRIDRIGQKRNPHVWILHCEGGVDDRAEELHKSRAVYEARIMHGLIGEDFGYEELVSACIARRHEQAAREQLEQQTQTDPSTPPTSQPVDLTSSPVARPAPLPINPATSPAEHAPTPINLQTSPAGPAPHLVDIRTLGPPPRSSEDTQASNV